jgi:hypothetical protein
MRRETLLLFAFLVFLSQILFLHPKEAHALSILPSQEVTWAFDFSGDMSSSTSGIIVDWFNVNIPSGTGVFTLLDELNSSSEGVNKRSVSVGSGNYGFVKISPGTALSSFIDDPVFYATLLNTSLSDQITLDSTVWAALENPDGYPQRRVNPVPEPSTFLLLGGGLAGLAFVARRRRKE